MAASKQLLVLCLVMAGAASCMAATTPSYTPGIYFMATLTPSQQNPPISSSLSHAYGNATLELISINGTLEVFYSLSIGGFNAGRNITAAHLHLAAAGINGPVVVPLYTSTPLAAPTTGVLTFTNDIGPSMVTGITMQNLVAAMESGMIYVNVHTNAYPDGEIRGQVMED